MDIKGYLVYIYKKKNKTKQTNATGPVRTFINRMQKNRIIIIVPGLTIGVYEQRK